MGFEGYNELGVGKTQRMRNLLFRNPKNRPELTRNCLRCDALTLVTQVEEKKDKILWLNEIV